MTPYTRQEISVGIFVTLGVLALAYLSLQLGGVTLFEKDGTRLSARFSSVGSLKVGDPVKIAGVSVGSVTSIALANYEAEANFTIDGPVKLAKDSIASIRSAGLLGDAYVSISPGADDEDLPNGGRITRTEPAVDVTDLIAKYAFGSPTDETEEAGAGSGSAKENDDPLGLLDEPSRAQPSATDAADTAKADGSSTSTAPSSTAPKNVQSPDTDSPSTPPQKTKQDKPPTQRPIFEDPLE